MPPLPHSTESDHTRVPRRRSWCCGGVAAADLRYCTHSLCRRHGQMVLWCTIHCVNCECSLFLSVLCGCALSHHQNMTKPEHDRNERWVSVRMYSHTIVFLHTNSENLEPTQTATTSSILCRRHGPIWPKLERHVASSPTCRDMSATFPAKLTTSYNIGCRRRQGMPFRPPLLHASDPELD